MTKQRPSITSMVMVLDPRIYKLGNAIETCTPFVGRVVRGELSATLTLGLVHVCRDTTHKACSTENESRRLLGSCQSVFKKGDQR